MKHITRNFIAAVLSVTVLGTLYLTKADTGTCLDIHHQRLR